MERRTIAKVEPRHMDHLLLIFTDGTQQMIQRDEHKGKHSHQEAGITGHTLTTVHHLKPGDVWPPISDEEKQEIPEAEQ